MQPEDLVKTKIIFDKVSPPMLSFAHEKNK